MDFKLKITVTAILLLIALIILASTGTLTILLIILPPVISAIPAELWAVIAFGLILKIVLILWNK